MSACDELRQTAAGVASLPAGDPDREQYLAHARTCPECMAALRQGEKLMVRLGEVRLPAPTAAALQRAAAPILAELRPARRVPQWLLQAAAVVPGFLAPIFLARHLELEGWGAALLVLVAATLLAGSAGTLRAGALVVLAASAGFAFAAGGVPGVPPSGAHLGAGELQCPLLEFIAAALPFAAAAWAYRGNLRPGVLAQAAAAGALAGQAALHLACPGRHDAVHLWVFHVAGVAAAALIGWMLESQLKSVRI